MMKEIRENFQKLFEQLHVMDAKLDTILEILYRRDLVDQFRYQQETSMLTDIHTQVLHVQEHEDEVQVQLTATSLQNLENSLITPVGAPLDVLSEAFPTKFPGTAFKTASSTDYDKNFNAVLEYIKLTDDQGYLPPYFTDQIKDQDEYSSLVGKSLEIEGAQITDLSKDFKDAHDNLLAKPVHTPGKLGVPLAKPFVEMVRELYTYASAIEKGLKECIQHSCVDQTGTAIPTTDSQRVLETVQNIHTSVLGEITQLISASAGRTLAARQMLPKTIQALKNDLVPLSGELLGNEFDHAKITIVTEDLSLGGSGWPMKVNSIKPEELYPPGQPEGLDNPDKAKKEYQSRFAHIVITASGDRPYARFAERTLSGRIEEAVEALDSKTRAEILSEQVNWPMFKLCRKFIRLTSLNPG
jgi:hypothetical protein